jgi:hypothetical protein
MLRGRFLACRAPAVEAGNHAVWLDGARTGSFVRYREELVPTARLATAAATVAEGETMLLLQSGVPLLSAPDVQLAAVFTPAVDGVGGSVGGAPVEVAATARGGGWRRVAAADGSEGLHWHVPVPHLPRGASAYELFVRVGAASLEAGAAHGNARLLAPVAGTSSTGLAAAAAAGAPSLRLEVSPHVQSVGVHRIAPRACGGGDESSSSSSSSSSSKEALRLTVHGAGFSPAPAQKAVRVGRRECRVVRADAHLIDKLSMCTCCTLRASATRASFIRPQWRPTGGHLRYGPCCRDWRGSEWS